MSLYEQYVLPHLINCACGSPPILKLRSQLVPQAEGAVLEVGMGSGINLPFYDTSKIDYVWGLEPSLGMRNKAAKRLAQSPVKVRWLDLPGEKIPLEDDSVDTILLTFTLCTIPDTTKALAQMRRVLKPNGKLLFCEHGEAEHARVKKWQNRLNPVWSKLAGGCQLNRQISGLISEAGFAIERASSFYVPKTPRFAGYIYTGEARIA
jgi:ubiquinone/menaquinone biosynthesis C-methylase UbiE